MKCSYKIIGTIFMIMGLLQVIAISILFGLNKVYYSSTSQFIGFMTNQELWWFFFGGITMALIGVVVLLFSDFKRKR